MTGEDIGKHDKCETCGGAYEAVNTVTKTAIRFLCSQIVGNAVSGLS